MNLHRRFDISLINTDEVKITLLDDINLIISENTQWDGNYKKMAMQGTFGDSAENKENDEFYRQLKKGELWTTADSTVSIQFSDYSYTLTNSGITENGVFTTEKIGGYNVIQFRSDFEASLLSEAYSMQFGTKTIKETVKRKTVEKTVTDYDNLTFTPVKITSTDCFATEGKTYILTREQIKE